MQYDLTEGNITKKLLRFALPLIAGNLLQQLYNVADTWIVGRFLGADALAAVGSSYTLMVFLTSILLGLCMGSGAFFSMQFGRRDFDCMKNGFFLSFLLIGAVTLLLNILVYPGMDFILTFMRVPSGIRPLMQEYLLYVFAGIFATFLYNYFASLLRAVGNSVIPLIFLAVCALLNVALDLLFVLVFHWGVKGAAIATALSQYVSGTGILLYYYLCFPHLRIKKAHMRWNASILKDIAGLSALTCLQQSVMNLGILMVQGLVNSFGTAVMAAFAAAVKIDSFAYMPVQDFGNAFSTFIAQNYGAGKKERIRSGIRSAAVTAVVFSLTVGLSVCFFARPLMGLFVDSSRADIIAIGAGYLRIEAVFYSGIGILFLFYGYFRAVGRPGISVILTVISLGTRVILAYLLSAIPQIGVTGIWVSIPIGWILADITGALLLQKYAL
ncbi:MATE efflux family protein [Marvinbryantia formatexigens DSM 14469]|uniref:Probable multidrug resistance protein NorM n=1 Tax=Marvinbryantia formatexigens DSM 14469 TaxID=478749 RepID=C6LDP5_9FIRM|nr:MATE family efflux transporter [Marvinbryantia formatexigens]EET61099.1 MATE efflux family protein [Marvinbryantia formatexigens DSM 14469]UWO23683.1 MATE family efflux transporter [Marvinbryantia formatexigens DSM 14469]SDF66160.1 putative efflux protein, MATE family [Marvinbryantia formatexigens]